MADKQTAGQSELQSLREENDRLCAVLADLQSRLKEPEEIVQAIRQGEVDAFVVSEPPGERVYTLRSADLLYRMLIEEMQEGAVALDPKGVVLYCNRHFAGLVKVNREQILGTTVFPLVAPAGQFAFDLLCQPYANRMQREEVELKAADGTMVPVMLTINPIRIEDLTVFCVIATDLTRQKQQQELLNASHRKDEFLAMLSHELRNPIAPIRNAAHMLRLAGVPLEDVQWAGEVIERQVLQLSRLVDDLLDVARISTGKFNLRMGDVDLRAVISAAVEEARPGIDSRGQNLTVDLPPGSLLMQGDAARLTQVVANLLSNATKFTSSAGSIRLGIEQQGEQAVIRVRDTGQGIPSDMLSRIFDAFMQVDFTAGRAQGGLGIGLALVKTIVELHGGQVSAASDGPGRGTEVTVRLPVLAEPANQADPTPLDAATTHRPRRVLIIDDNGDSAESMAVLVRHWGHDAHVATTAHHGLEAAGAIRPHVVFMDIGMPGTNGYDLARQLRRLPGLECAVLVAVTGYGQEEDRRRTREAGFDHHWVKPANLDAIEALLRVIG